MTDSLACLCSSKIDKMSRLSRFFSFFRDFCGLSWEDPSRVFRLHFSGVTGANSISLELFGSVFMTVLHLDVVSMYGKAEIKYNILICSVNLQNNRPFCVFDRTY